LEKAVWVLLAFGRAQRAELLDALDHQELLRGVAVLAIGRATTRVALSLAGSLLALTVRLLLARRQAAWRGHDRGLLRAESPAHGNADLKSLK